MKTIREYIDQAVEVHGSQAKLAEAIGCSQQQISYLKNAKGISAEMAMRLDAATDGKVSKHDLRPDIFPPPQTPASAA